MERNLSERDRSNEEVNHLENIKFEKLGLALSGGGFRAAFFHLGVLASLADTGVLKNVKVLSTVSGGTIIGVLYFLKLKEKIKLLNGVESEEQTNKFYREIIEEIEKDFYDFVKLNIRTKSFLNPIKNTQIFFSELLFPIYTRSKYIGELIEKHLYRNYREKPEKPLLMSDLHSDNPNLPKLVINTTTINTGNNWVFQTDNMRQLDVNLRSNKNISLPKIDYIDQQIRLSDAVAASACVPGIFKPIRLMDMFNHNGFLDLVDGGVYDNQGIEPLIQEGCSHFIISDGAKQLENKYISKTTLEIVGRTNDILMSRVRELQLNKLFEKYKLNNIAFVHLLYGTNPVVWFKKGTSLEAELSKQPQKSTENEIIPSKYLNLLSKIRTDLDSFTEVEAYSLIYCGYAISNEEIKSRYGIHSTNQLEFVNRAAGIFSDGGLDEGVKDQLQIGKNRFFKWFDLLLLNLKEKKSNSNVNSRRNGLYNLLGKLGKLIIFIFVSYLLVINLNLLIEKFIPIQGPIFQIIVFIIAFFLCLTIIIPAAAFVFSIIVLLSLNTLNRLFLHLGRIKQHR